MSKEEPKKVVPSILYTTEEEGSRLRAEAELDIPEEEDRDIEDVINENTEKDS